MPELTVTHIALLAVALIIGVTVGWIFRGKKSATEKSAINVTWQEQLEAQRQEHERLVDQNKSLMEQNSQYQASNNDSKMRASELSDALQFLSCETSTLVQDVDFSSLHDFCHVLFNADEFIYLD